MSESIRTSSPFVQTHPSLKTPGGRIVALRPTLGEWVRHAALFVLTWLTTALGGIINAIEPGQMPEPVMAEPARWVEYIFLLPVYYLQTIGAVVTYALAHPAVLVEGVTFACALLTILLAHEAGHYLACRRYGVEATLPFFLPSPPLFLPGTFGAFIKIKSPIPSRRALFDIGVAGPLAGFVVILPIALLAMLTSSPAPPLPSDGLLLIFNDSWLVKLLAGAAGVDLSNVKNNPFHFAAWVGLLVTSLNLLPVGQLDGGHASYSFFGARVHKQLGRAVFGTSCALAVLGWLWHGAPGGFIYALLLFIMLRVRHPQAQDESEPLGRTRVLVALLTIVVFLLSFTPFPITIR